MRHLVIILALLALAGCQSNGGTDTPAADSTPAARESAPEAVAADVFAGPVVETMNAAGYTYVCVDTGDGKVWAAGPQQDMEVGTPVHISKAMPMAEFYSETLDRTFDVLYFVSGFGEEEGDHSHPAPAAEGGDDPHAAMMGEANPHAGVGATSNSEVELRGIEPADQTVAVIHAEKTALAGQPVRVRGKVVKALAGIMGTNWMHIQDGTGEAGANDLTVTSDTLVEVGSTVLVEGVLSTDRDFGSGYRYGVIVENAKITVE